jgi:hypothetical protein
LGTLGEVSVFFLGLTIIIWASFIIAYILYHKLNSKVIVFLCLMSIGQELSYFAAYFFHKQRQANDK